MKQTTLFIFFYFVVNFVQAQSFTILPSLGSQTIKTNVSSNNFVGSDQLKGSNATSSIMVYRNNTKGHGLIFSISSVSSGLSFNYIQNGASSFMRSSTGVTRLDIGYQLMSKKIYFNNIVESQHADKKGKGLFMQFQGYTTLGYNIGNKSSNGLIGASNGNLKIDYIGYSNFSLVTGVNMFFGKNDKKWFFININKNFNFGSNSAGGVFTTNANGITSNYYLQSRGSGTSFSIGVPISLNFRKKSK